MVGKVALVTGANKGLGFAIVKGLCEKYKGKVYLTSRDQTRGENAVRELNKIVLKPDFHILDITDEESVKSFAEFLIDKEESIDVLVNNAAILRWDEVYPSYDTAKHTVEVNYKSLMTIESYLYPLLNDNARVVNISSACGTLSNLRNEKWIEKLKDKNSITREDINTFVDEYLDSVKSGTFDKNDFADDGKHAEHRVAKIALTALTFVQQNEYGHRGISINAVHPGHVKTDMANGGGEIDADEAAKVVLYLVFEASSKLQGTFMWYNKKLIDWCDHEADNYCSGLW